jgi:ferritin-like metal-binding protein YciE
MYTASCTSRNLTRSRDMAQRDLLIAWLNDAYAMEQALIPILENHARDARTNRDVHDRTLQHAYDTRRHADMIRACVERLGSRTSMVKTGLGRAFGMIQSIATGASDDDQVKNTLLDIAAEHFEIACYHALISAAQDYGDTQTADACREILRDEENFAHYLESTLHQTVLNVMHDYAAVHA